MDNPGSERDPLEVLAAEYMERLRRGEAASIEQYASEHPGLAGEIRELFPTIAVTERLKARQERSSGGLATLGATRLERLGDFRIIREIGRGGMGVVFEAEQESLGRRVAVKVLPRQVLFDEKHLKRFQREARIAANLHHTNIVEVFGVGEQDGFHYYVMQYIQGVGLDAVIPEIRKRVHEPAGNLPGPGSLSPEVGAGAVARALLGEEAWQAGSTGSLYWQNVARIGLQAAEALHHAHRQGTLHRDIKPANLLLDARGTVWLADFGLAKAAQSDEVSLSNDLVGTLRYMAPEQFRGSADHRSDLCSLGLSLYELLALRPAFSEADRSRLVRRILYGPPPTPGSFQRLIPQDLETIILKAVAHDPAQRYQSAEALAEDLRRFLQDRPIQARRVSPVERLARWSRRNKALAGLGATVLSLLLLVAAIASTAYVHTRRALEGEARERANAQANADLAMEALDRMSKRFSPGPLRTLPQPSDAGNIVVPDPPILSRQAAALLADMLPFYDRLAQQTGNNEKWRAETAEANRRVGLIRQRLGQYEESVQAYRRAAVLLDELRPRWLADPMLKLQAAQIRNELGRIYASRRQFAESRESHLAALGLLEENAPSRPVPERERFELARTYYFLGTQERPLPSADLRVAGGPGQLAAESRGNLAKAVSLLRNLSSSAGDNPDTRHLLALCYLEGATVGTTGEGERKNGAERAMQMLEELVQAFPDVPDYAYDLSEACARIRIPRPPVPAELQRTIEDRFGKGLSLLEKLMGEHPDIPDYRAAAARLQDKLGSFYRQTDRGPEAEQAFRKAIALQSPLVSQFPEAPYYAIWMATFRIGLADALLRRDLPKEASIELESTLSTLLRQLEQRPDTPRPRELLTLGYSKLATAYRQMGERTQAEQALQNAQQEHNPGH